MIKQIGFPIFSSENKKLADKSTILAEPIPSIDLLERACYQLVRKLEKEISQDVPIHIVCGNGNNGADGLCIARILNFKGYSVEVSVLQNQSQFTIEHNIQFRLLELTTVKITRVKNIENFFISKDQLIIDAIIGAGLNKALDGEIRKIVLKINELNPIVFSIDNPTGIGTWDHFEGQYIHANKTFCLGTVSPALLSRNYQQDIVCVDIGLIETQGPTPLGWFLMEGKSTEFIESILPKHKKHDHKGNRGHALVIGGNMGMHGAVCMSAKMASNVGAGNVTICSQTNTLPYITTMPEIQFKESALDGKAADYLEIEGYESIAIGPGLGVSAKTTAFLSFMLGKRIIAPMVFDADALNIIAKNKNLIQRVPENSILTPHPKELERLFGKFDNENSKWKFLSEFARKQKIHILAKDTYSILFCADGEIYVNGTGNERLAKGGSGDKLTGLIAGYLAQGLKAKHAAICGMFELIEFA
jgi:NAD(P)H-hydrate epimerase